MKKIYCILLFLLLCSCQKETVYLSEQDSGHGIVIDIGQTAIIALAENRTTGYGWEFEIEPQEQDVIGNIKEKHIYQQTKLVGAGGIKEFGFKAKNTGKIRIKAYYRRPWENVDKKALQSVNYTITVK